MKGYDRIESRRPIDSRPAERLAVAGSGVPTVYAGNRALHSRYDPAGEAEKYINTLNLREGTGFFILIEPGLGYCVPVLRRRFPGARIIALHVSDFFASGPSLAGSSLTRAPEAPASLTPDARWSPGSGVSPRRFLADLIPDTEARRLKIIEWRPSLAAYGGAYRELLAETAAFIKEIDANARTVRGFGRRWFKNALKNTALIRGALRYAPLNLPCVIAGAGPSLEETIPLIKEQRERGPLFILGVSSAVPALRAGGLEPDLVLATDGGGWALFHLYETLRAALPALAISLNAALPSQCGAAPILPISDGSLWQGFLLESLGVPYLSLPQRGTVTAAALDLALGLTVGKVFFTGMDLANRDIRTHARPYSFDRFQEERACRLSPRYSQAYSRAAEIRTAGSHDLYAAWFARQIGAYPKRVYSLGDNNPLFQSLKTGFDAPGSPGSRADFRLVPPRRPGGGPAAVQALCGALRDPALSPRLVRELGPLLLPDEPEAGAEGLIREALDLAGPYGGGGGDG
jgi:hypothetical protein